MKFSTYSRVSSSEQVKGQSVDNQIAENRAYGFAQGWEHYQDYRDDGLSARDDQRPGFQQCIRDALSGEFETIVVHSFDRFSRDLENSVVYKGLLKRAGVRVVSVIEPVDESPMGFLQEGIADLFAAFYSINLSVKIRKGLIRTVKQGNWPHKPPYGYKKEDGWVVVSEMGVMIQNAFNEFATGKYTPPFRQFDQLVVDLPRVENSPTFFYLISIPQTFQKNTSSQMGVVYV